MIATTSIGHISIRPEGSSTGSVLGGTGSDSGEISAYSIGSVSVAGKILGGGTSVSNGSGGTTITGADSGRIATSGSIGSAKIGGGITGGIGNDSGVIAVGSGFSDKLGSLDITGGGITGGAGTDSGQVTVGGQISSVNLNGAAITGGAGAASGAILATDSIGPVSLGSLIGGAGASSGEISAGGNLKSLTFRGAALHPPRSAVLSVYPDRRDPSMFTETLLAPGIPPASS